MVSQTVVGWMLDVSQDHDTDNIVILIKLQEDNKVISFKQRVCEYVFYILPKSRSAGEDLIQQLSTYDQLIKRIFWDEKYIDLSDKNKTRLIVISLDDSGKQDYKRLIKKLEMDSRVSALYNTEPSKLRKQTSILSKQTTSEKNLYDIHDTEFDISAHVQKKIVSHCSQIKLSN
jgi:hypothetical protein